MEDREVLKTDASRHLIMQDAVQSSGERARRNDFEALESEWSRSCERYLHGCRDRASYLKPNFSGAIALCRVDCVLTRHATVSYSNCRPIRFFSLRTTSQGMSTASAQ
jgi:hypothetical protein